MPFHQLAERTSPKKLFLLDSLGALLTALLLAFVLSNMETLFGMPKHILYLLAGIAFVFCLYSFSCFLTVDESWPIFLKVIAVANFLYCLLTLILLLYLQAELRFLDNVYFLSEASIVLALAIFEWKKAVSTTPGTTIKKI